MNEGLLCSKHYAKNWGSEMTKVPMSRKPSTVEKQTYKQIIFM